MWLCVSFSIAGFVLAIANAHLKIISRSEWKAQQPKYPLSPIPNQYLPVPYAIIHHSGGNTDCSGKPCAEIVRNIQRYHQDTRGWDDIGYNFIIAPTGDVFEGRGWGKVGAQAPGYNNKSMGICLIGNFETAEPNPAILSATLRLTQLGMDLGQISRNYTLLGHRQVRTTTCPGDFLYEKIQHWPHWKEKP